MNRYALSLFTLCLATSAISSDNISNIMNVEKEMKIKDNPGYRSGEVHENPIKKPLIIELYNPGGYSAKYSINYRNAATNKYYDEGSGTVVSAYYTFEIPIDTDLHSITVKAITNTGLSWNPHVQVFNEHLDRTNIGTFGARHYYGFHLWGTSHHPFWARYTPHTGVQVGNKILDIYSKNPFDCTAIEIWNDKYSQLINRTRQYDLINKCRYAVSFFLTKNNQSEKFDVQPDNTGYAFSSYADRYDNHYHVRHAQQ